MNKEKANKPAQQSRGSEFLCRLKYMNNLPEIPFDPKMLKYPFEKNRFIKYNITSLEENYKWNIHTEQNLGININLLDPHAYESKLPPSAPLPDIPAEDMILLEPPAPATAEKATPAATTGTSPAPGKFRPSVPWLRKTEYMSAIENLNRSKMEERNLLKKKEEDLPKREESIAAIEETFEAAKLEPVHPTNPELKVESCVPIFPNLDLWANVFTQLVFDRDPTPATMDPEEADACKDNAIVKGYKSEDGENFVAFLVPKKRKRDDCIRPGEEEEYEWMREYNYRVKKGADVGCDSYFFTFEQDAVLYNEISSRVHLSKPLHKITVRCRALTENELKDRQNKLDELLDTSLKETERSQAEQQDESEVIKDDEEEIMDE